MVDNEKQSFLKRFKNTVRNRMISGLLVLVPLGITVVVLELLFSWTAGFFSPIIAVLLPEDINQFYVKLISIAVFVILIYVVGVITAAVIGKRFLTLGEWALMKIPIVKSIYSASKQVVEAVSLPSKAAFKAVVIVEFPRQGMKAIGFLTGQMKDERGDVLYKIFIPTTPNPTSGFLEMVRPEETVITDMPMEEAFKMIMSGGIISPERINAQKRGQVIVMAAAEEPRDEKKEIA